MAYSHHSSVKIPGPVSSLAFGSQNVLAVGSDDGSLRLYELPANKVTKAIRGLKQDISSICWVTTPAGDQKGRVWLASGRTAYLYDLNCSKMILTPEDVTTRLDLGEDEEDVLNELSINNNNKSLAFSTDAGTVGVIDLSNMQVTRVRTSHTSICSTVKYIPDRPNELVSGGYDSAVLHFDYKQGGLLSRFDISSAPPSSGISISPPFVLSISLSSSGLFAATTADGRVWVGSGGDKSLSSSNKKKRSRKWEGLKESDGSFIQIADGPVVASAFISSLALLTCTLLGKLSLSTVTYDDEHKPHLETTWNGSVETLEKVNTVAVSDKWLTIGGFTKDEVGLVEIWEVKTGVTVEVEMSKLSI